MPFFLVEYWLDGYEDEKAMAEACAEAIDDQLDFSGSSVKVFPMSESEGEALKTKLKESK